MLSNAQKQAKDGAREQARRQREIAKEQLGEQTEMAKEELGRIAFAKLEEYFPEQANARRRQDAAKTFMIGIAVGILLRHLFNR